MPTARIPAFRAVAVALTVGALLTACTSPAAGPAAPSRSASPGEAELVETRLVVPDGTGDAPFDRERTVLAPEGWKAQVWARLDDPRLAAWTPDRKLLVSRPDAGDVQLLNPQSDAAAPPEVTTLLRGLQRPHGLAFHNDTLYVAESDRVSAYPYSAGQVGERRTVVDGLPDASTAELRGAYAHALKSVAVASDGTVYVSVGSTGNISVEDRAGKPERASILQVKDGRASTFASGVRNGTGLAIAPDGSVWTAVNNRDQTPYPYDRDYDGDGTKDEGALLRDYVADHPLEPVAKLTAGRDLGWPYCNPDPDADPGTKGTDLTYTDRPFVRDADTNANGAKLDCAALQKTESGLPAHSAPLGMAFATAEQTPTGWGAGALIGVHGSWNRTPPRAPEVAFLPWADGTLGAPKTLLGGFQLTDGSRWGRPVAAVSGPDGAIYVTDDEAGAVYRLAPA